MAPTIAPCLEMGRAARWIGTQVGRDLRNGKVHQAGFDDHFRSELHTSTAKVQTFNDLSLKSAQATVEITYFNAKKDASEHAENWIAKKAM